MDDQARTEDAQDGAEGPRAERKRGSGVQFVYDTLRSEILDLTLPPGSPVDEIQIAERLGMSRTPVREALVRLATEGLVSTLPNRSTIVAPIDFLNLSPFFDALTLMYRVTTRLAAEHHEPADLPLIRARQSDFERAAGQRDVVGMILTNRDFHVTIAEAGRNPYYTGLFVRLLDEGRRILRVYYSSYQDILPQEFIAEHEEMIAAIAARDPARADRVATAHADQIVRQIQAVIARDRRQSVPLG